MYGNDYHRRLLGFLLHVQFENRWLYLDEMKGTLSVQEGGELIALHSDSSSKSNNILLLIGSYISNILQLKGFVDNDQNQRIDSTGFSCKTDRDSTHTHTHTHTQ